MSPAGLALGGVGAEPPRERSADGDTEPLTGAVTPVRIDVDPVFQGDRVEVTPPVGSDATAPRVLRSVLDWFTLLLRRSVSVERFAELVRSAEVGAVLSVPSRSGALTLEVRRLGRDVVLKGLQGVRALVRDPASVAANDTGPEESQRYGLDVQIQGAAFSAVRGVGACGDLLVASVWDALAAELYGDQVEDAGRALLSETRVGRVDFATDCEVEDSFARGAIYGSGDLDRAASRWSTRARKWRAEAGSKSGEESAAAWVPVTGRRSLLGKETSGRTLYLGSGSYVLLCVYERSKLRTGDWAVLEPTLRAEGWDGERLVVRSELRVSRKWMRDQVPKDAEGRPKYLADDEDGRGRTARSLADLSLGEWMNELPAVCAELATRFRHVEDDDTDARRRRDRASSPWWSAVTGALSSWHLCEGDGEELSRIASTRRALSLRRSIRAARSALERVEALSGEASESVTVGWSRAVAKVLEASRETEWAEGRADRIARLRARYAVEVIRLRRVA